MISSSNIEAKLFVTQRQQRSAIMHGIITEKKHFFVNTDVYCEYEYSSSACKPAITMSTNHNIPCQTSLCDGGQFFLAETFEDHCHSQDFFVAARNT